MKPGLHRGRVIAGILTETKAHREYVFLKLADSADLSDAVGWAGYFGDDIGKDGKTSTERTTEQLRCCGWEGDDVRDLESCKRNEVEFNVTNEEFNGNFTLKAGFIQPIGTAAKYMPKGLAETNAQRFADRIKSRLRGEKPDYGMKAPAEGEFAPPVDDDIPF